MSGNAIFNATVCVIGIAILFIHVVNLLIKKERRKDENRLLIFLLFTAFHFITYLTFTIIKVYYTSNPFIISFYTVFYIFNNVEVFLLFLYMLSYVSIREKAKKALSIINAVFFSAFVILDLVNIFTGIFFTAVDGTYLRSKFMILAQGYEFILFAIVLFVTAFNEYLVAREKISFALYCILPLVAIVIQTIFKGYAIGYLSIIIAIEILFFFLNVKKNIQLLEEQEKTKDAQIRVMMSQIQPHFIYNSLSSISTLIPLEPLKAQKALDSFTEYLRHNISSLTETNLIPFEAELRHIETYLALEKLRFKDRIQVQYEIKTKNFNVPPLSIQPLVENAVKHGILKKVEGGFIMIKAYETYDSYVVEIRDDGVGFDLSKVDFTENEHFGINNIKTRLKNLRCGLLEIKSSPGKGAKATIVFYKQ